MGVCGHAHKRGIKDAIVRIDGDRAADLNANGGPHGKILKALASRQDSGPRPLGDPAKQLGEFVGGHIGNCVMPLAGQMDDVST